MLARKAGDGIELMSVDRGPGMTASALARALSAAVPAVPSARRSAAPVRSSGCARPPYRGAVG